MGYNSYMNDYQHMLNLGFSEREAERECEDNFAMGKYSQHDYEEEAPLCDICGVYGVAACVNGYYVCSRECSDIAEQTTQTP